MPKNRSRGFTLAELLIVVAIIAVLVAVAIPVFSNQLECAREAVDVSNLRQAYSVAKMDYLTGAWKDSSKYYSNTGIVTPVCVGRVYGGYYNVDTNTVQSNRPSLGYGKSTKLGTSINTSGITMEPTKDCICYGGAAAKYGNDGNGTIRVYIDTITGDVCVFFNGEAASGENAARNKYLQWQNNHKKE